MRNRTERLTKRTRCLHKRVCQALGKKDALSRALCSAARGKFVPAVPTPARHARQLDQSTHTALSQLLTDMKGHALRYRDLFYYKTCYKLQHLLDSRTSRRWAQ